MRPRALLQSLKYYAGGQHQLCLLVGSPGEAILRPVATHPERIEKEDVRRLSEWRNRHVSAFLTEFHATEERTAAWLVKAVGPDDTRILFMVEAPAGRVIGYMGLAFIDWDGCSAEADAVVRGEEAPRGLMTRCLRHLLGWARNQLGIKLLSVRVRSDNPALTFYTKFGFAEVRREALVRTTQSRDVLWQPVGEQSANDSPTLIHMILDNEMLNLNTLNP